MRASGKDGAYLDGPQAELAVAACFEPDSLQVVSFQDLEGFCAVEPVLCKQLRKVGGAVLGDSTPTQRFSDELHQEHKYEVGRRKIVAGCGPGCWRAA